jgi:two-component system, cell cycle sensor histidine kinase and response regulator CckA
MADFWRPDSRSRAEPPLGGGRVMIVDDEVQVCVYVALALKRLGFESKACTDPTEALQAILADPEAYRILLTDQRMPGLTGLELINLVWQSHPDFPVILMSGYGWGFSPASLPGVGLLSKPFEIGDLEKALGNALQPA